MSPTTPTALASALLFLLAASSVTPPASAALCHPDDKTALLAFKKAFNDPYYIISWKPDTDCCGWSGIGCNDAGRVDNLFLSGADLAGPIPPFVGDLPYLRILELRKNSNLTGPIPQDITRLTRLTMLWLDWNSLTGSVPDFLSVITTLTYINLSFNKFSGDIPASLASLPLLGALFLDRNQLTGSLPAAFSTFQLKDLYLRLSHNQLTGTIPKSFAELDIQVMDLGGNQLAGDASPLFGANKSTITIDISRNLFEFDLTGVEFPAGIQNLDLNHNRIYGKLPAQITTLGRLGYFNVSYNRLCGEIPQGGQIEKFDQYSFFHNKCLCGNPLPPCK